MSLSRNLDPVTRDYPRINKNVQINGLSGLLETSNVLEKLDGAILFSAIPIYFSCEAPEITPTFPWGEQIMTDFQF